MNYILNIKTGKIHSGKNPCRFCQKMGKANKKFFDKYEDAVNFFEGNTVKGNPCNLCLKEMNE
jgi:hypothetical protein